MGVEGHVLKRIPRIKFPERHPKSSASGSFLFHCSSSSFFFLLFHRFISWNFTNMKLVNEFLVPVAD